MPEPGTIQYYFSISVVNQLNSLQLTVAHCGKVEKNLVFVKPFTINNKYFYH
jgi:hypothetical protein